MNEHFIRNIEIKNFKCFENFKAEGFGRVNLIGGKNNVGKTAFMEACLFNLSSENSLLKNFVKALISIQVSRNYSWLYDLSNSNNTTYMKYIISFLSNYKNSEINTNLHHLAIKFKQNVQITLNKENFDNDDFEPIFTETEIPLSYNFITSMHIGSEQLIHLYDQIKLLRKREFINKFINKFDSDLIEYEIIDNMPVCFSKKINSFVNLDEYGNGLKRYIAYVCAIWANQDGNIYIDEIENGIHYTNLDKLWEVILKTSKEANVQVFATTHSKECIESYARVAKKLNDKEIGFIELGRNKKNELDSVVMDSEMFQRFVKLGNEVRGW